MYASIRRQLRPLARLVPMLLLALSCGEPGEHDDEAPPVSPLGFVRQAITDTDSDGMDDAWEIANFGSLSQTASGDFDSDGMTNLEEYTYGFNPTVKDALEDADGDRYPNIWEIRRGSDPNDAGSIPTPNFTVDASGGGTHTTISAAVNAATIASGAYQIIGILPGTYSGAANDIALQTSKPKFLIIGLQGAAKTIIDGSAGGSGDGYGWALYNSAVIASLTFRHWWQGIYVNSPGQETRLVDLIVRDNANASWPGGVHIEATALTYIIGSTFIDNVGGASNGTVWVQGGSAKLVNTVIWGSSTQTMLVKAASSTLVTNNCLVKGQTLTGTGNLAGTTDPKLHSDGHILWDSPLRGAGGSISQSRVDMDGESRPSSAPDIGADQFVDSDSDDLADRWELATAGNLTSLTSRTGDADGDGLSNDGEYLKGTDPLATDTDGDGVSDGDEVNTYSTNPLLTDTDGDDMPDGFEVAHGLNPTVRDGFEDKDGDGYPNVFEYARGSDPANSASKPTPNFTVDASGGGTHTTVSSAVAAANIASGAYQIIGIAPGTYSGAVNDITLPTTKPKFLIIGLQGAAKTIIDGSAGGSGDGYGWALNNSAVIASLTFRRWWQAIYVNAPNQEVRLIDLLVRDNSNASWPGGVHIESSALTSIIGSTFIDNVGGASNGTVWVQSGSAKLLNTVIWGSSSQTMLVKAAPATLVTNNCLVKGQTLTGTGNLAGSTNPKLNADGHLLWDSPLRAAGGTVAQSLVDMDGESRPTSAPDIGADQFVDSDSDQLADRWELAYAGNLTTLTGRTQDADGDGLSNDGEYTSLTNPIVGDTDGDGVSDGAEILTYHSNPLSTDSDGDDMPDGWEVAHGLDPAVANAYEDADGDRYPNVFEYARGTDPSDPNSIPTANYTVDAAGGGTHTTIPAAVTASNIVNGKYQIIGVTAGVYGGLTSKVGILASKPRLLIIGLSGAANTIIDGAALIGDDKFGWGILNSAVVSSLTFTHFMGALYVDPGTTGEVRLVDLMVRDNNGDFVHHGGVRVLSGSKTFITGCTFLNNTGPIDGEQIHVEAGTTTLTNTVVWGPHHEVMVGASAGGSIVTNYSLVKGQTLSGTGNLAGTVDPKLRVDGRLRIDSPLRHAGGTVATSRIDIDGEQRPSSSPDIGADQFVDADSDGLPDSWEIATAGDLTTIDGTADDDTDGLSNAEEYEIGTDYLDPDTDGDGIIDGLEVAYGMDPTLFDLDDLPYMGDDGLLDAIGFELGYPLVRTDDDGDGLSNADEVALGLDPFRVDTDGDGVPDNLDKFPHDPLMSSLVVDAGDTTPPQITLTDPWYAVEQ